MIFYWGTMKKTHIYHHQTPLRKLQYCTYIFVWKFHIQCILFESITLNVICESFILNDVKVSCRMWFMWKLHIECNFCESFTLNVIWEGKCIPGRKQLLLIEQQMAIFSWNFAKGVFDITLIRVMNKKQYIVRELFTLTYFWGKPILVMAFLGKYSSEEIRILSNTLFPCY